MVKSFAADAGTTDQRNLWTRAHNLRSSPCFIRAWFSFSQHGVSFLDSDLLQKKRCFCSLLFRNHQKCVPSKIQHTDVLQRWTDVNVRMRGSPSRRILADLGGSLAPNPKNVNTCAFKAPKGLCQKAGGLSPSPGSFVRVAEGFGPKRSARARGENMRPNESCPILGLKRM